MTQKINPFLWSGLFMVASLALSLYVAAQEKVFVAVNQIASPNVSLAPAALYFFGAVAVVAVALFFIPLNKLRLVFRILFTLMYAWGVFIVTGLLLPPLASYAVTAIAVIAWVFWASIWLQNVLLLVTLAGAGAVYGFLFSPWTFLILLLIVAVYDFLAVRFGFMVWMADRLSGTANLPAFIMPRSFKDWILKPEGVKIGELKEQPREKREYSILGGGDIGFPLALVVSVFFASGLSSAIVVGAFALIGLVAALLIQMYWLKGKPMPALPPIAIACLIGFLVASRYFR